MAGGRGTRVSVIRSLQEGGGVAGGRGFGRNIGVAAGGRSRFGLSAEGANSAHYGSLATLNLEPRLLMPLSYVLLFVVCLCVAVAVCLLLLLRLDSK